ncbi:MAG: DUF5131 family protein [Methylovirgula sp.]
MILPLGFRCQVYNPSTSTAITTEIEWTDATWNPTSGCSKITRGCDFCYTERFSERFRGVPGHAFENGFDPTLRLERLAQPLNWRQPRRVFVNSMSDLFHKEVPRTFIDAVFDTMEAADWDTSTFILISCSPEPRDDPHPRDINAAPQQTFANANVWKSHPGSTVAKTGASVERR